MDGFSQRGCSLIKSKMVAKVFTDKSMYIQFCMDYKVDIIDVLPTIDSSYKVVGGYLKKDFLDGAEYLIPEIVLTKEEYLSWESLYIPEETAFYYYEYVQPEAFCSDEFNAKLWHFALVNAWELYGTDRFSEYEKLVLSTKLQCEKFEYDNSTESIVLLDWACITECTGYPLVALCPIKYISLEDFEDELALTEDYIDIVFSLTNPSSLRMNITID